MKPTYTKLAADGSDLPADSTEKHLAVRVDHPLLKIPLIVAAYRCGKFVWKNAAKKAEAHDAYGWQWRLPPSRSCSSSPIAPTRRTRYRRNSSRTPKDYEWTWSSTVDAQSPSGFAWGVDLGYGYSFRGYQGDHGAVRAVRAGQF
jgi:hypothetical protein